ncbi:DUF4245 domain-containing protein [Corynebacterium tapiri]|uniref:DUF4245 domain-containing protein n=1 Tax=Corynebacterium tapiri TaxID=1448266 RepID=A0A5C4U7G0_9CORY|nr:DUF4245 domain-containing protein [Corynebacterium tapiri]TNM00508.1 DUF4245 domain-containing protein [Corynebacterium tapiri]
MASEQKPRIFQGGKDMVISAAIIVLMMLLVVIPTGMCSFNPGAPENGPVQEVDARSFLELESRAADFPVVIPETPEGWVPNSARRTSVDRKPAPVVGYVTADEGYLQLTQTDVPLEKAVEGTDNELREHTSTEVIDGTDVQIFSSKEKDVRDIWAAQHGETTFLITGAASAEEFKTLMSAALRG